MIILVAVFVPLALLSTVLFFKTAPKQMVAGERMKCNLVVVGIALGGCLAVSFYFYFTTGKSADAAWWPILAVLSSLLVFSAVVSLGGVVRNGIYNKRKSP